MTASESVASMGPEWYRIQMVQVESLVITRCYEMNGVPNEIFPTHSSGYKKQHLSYRNHETKYALKAAMPRRYQIQYTALSTTSNQGTGPEWYRILNSKTH